MHGPGRAEQRDGDVYARALGEQLRSVRVQQGLSLHEVEERSGGELKASVLGAYERGERAVSVTRLQVLARFFQVPPARLLPESPRAVTESSAHERVVIDLVALERARDDEPVLARYVGSITSRREDHNARVLTVRAADLDTLAAVEDTSAHRLRDRLESAGIVSASSGGTEVD